MIEAKLKVPEEAQRQKPWRYYGYQTYSNFIASDNDFLIYRRFDGLAARLLLRHQDRVAALEEELAAVDLDAALQDDPEVHNGTFRGDVIRRRKDLLQDLRTESLDYYELLLRYHEVRKLPSAKKASIDSVHNWHYSHRYHAIDKQEIDYLNHEFDLAVLDPQAKSGLRRGLERTCSRFIHLCLGKRDQRNLRTDVGPTRVDYMSNSIMEILAKMVTITVGMMLLIAPLWILAFVGRRTLQLTVITSFLVVFTVLLSTVAREFETLAAAAAYAAVLVVFLQISPTNT